MSSSKIQLNLVLLQLYFLIKVFDIHADINIYGWWNPSWKQNNLFWQHGECERSPCDDFIISANSWRFSRCCFTHWRKLWICWKKAGAVRAVGGEQKSAGNALCPIPLSCYGSEIWAIFSKTPMSLSPCLCALRTPTDFTFGSCMWVFYLGGSTLLPLPSWPMHVLLPCSLAS